MPVRAFCSICNGYQPISIINHYRIYHPDAVLFLCGENGCNNYYEYLKSLSRHQRNINHENLLQTTVPSESVACKKFKPSTSATDEPKPGTSETDEPKPSTSAAGPSSTSARLIPSESKVKDDATLFICELLTSCASS